MPQTVYNKQETTWPLKEVSGGRKLCVKMVGWVSNLHITSVKCCGAVAKSLLSVLSVVLYN